MTQADETETIIYTDIDIEYAQTIRNQKDLIFFIDFIILFIYQLL